MIGCRDPLGVRPLVLGDLDGAPILASETCALDIIGARFVRDIEPGEMVIITPRGHRKPVPVPRRTSRASASSSMSISPGRIRASKAAASTRCGSASAPSWRASAGRSPTSSCRCPDSGTPAAIGFAEAAGLPFDLGIIRNHYVGRTFIEPTDAIRHMGVRLKHNANRDVLAGKRVVLVDDSIVRGTTSLKIVQMIRDAGATEVHMRIASPPTMHSCFYGVDTPEESKLIAAQHVGRGDGRTSSRSTASASCRSTASTAPSAKRSANADAPQFCDACFTGDYPTRLTDRESGDNVRPFPQLAEVG